MKIIRNKLLKTVCTLQFILQVGLQQTTNFWHTLLGLYKVTVLNSPLVLSDMIYLNLCAFHEQSLYCCLILSLIIFTP